MRSTWICLLFLVLIASGTQATAAQYKQWGEYRIHYTTFASTVIPAEVANLHNITRADDRIIINISVKKGDEPVPVAIDGHLLNLLEQLVTLDFVQVREPDAIYYLATHRVNEEDILRFNLKISVAEDPNPYELRFLRRYH